MFLQQPKVLSDTVSPDRREDADGGYEMIKSQEGPLSPKEINNGYSLLEGQTGEELNSVDNHTYFVLEREYNV